MERERDRVDKVMARNAMELIYNKKKLKLKGGDRNPTALLEEGDPFQIPNDSQVCSNRSYMSVCADTHRALRFSFLKPSRPFITEHEEKGRRIEGSSCYGTGSGSRDLLLGLHGTTTSVDDVVSRG